MTWVRLETDFPEHPKVVGLSDDAFRAFIAGLCYCNHYLTDGHIPTAAIKKITRRRLRPAAELIEAGLWEQNGSGVIVHDYLDFQPTRSEVEAKRERIRQVRSEAGRKGGLRSGESRRAKQT